MLPTIKELKSHKTISIYLIITTIFQFVGAWLFIYLIATGTKVIEFHEPLMFFIFLSLYIIGMTVGLIPIYLSSAALASIYGFQSILFIVPVYLVSITIGYFITKLFDKNKFLGFLEEKYNLKAYREIAQEELSFIPILRFAPVVPFTMSNSLFYLLDVRFIRYLFLSLLGMLPRTLIFIYIGSLFNDAEGIKGVLHSGWYKITSIVVLLLCLSVINYIFKQKLKIKQLQHEKAATP